ncbi:uncharacterized protein DUF4129 [Motilibacter peucedani]|uniref:Uncharacterized protein DUF4129 n=1 Tax=Motilibacter peucedani TaxID=598650 RepID=A0A420XQG6_9ACTN|nr:DUF4129 domain-containing protein [Motilibacter peucedani]RKS75499.1 uncharacterized protein DUF4129 [Motilibacter peucedani]
MPRLRPQLSTRGALPPGVLPVVLVAAVVLGSALAGPWHAAIHLPGVGRIDLHARIPHREAAPLPPAVARPGQGGHTSVVLALLLVALLVGALLVVLLAAVLLTRALSQGWRPPFWRPHEAPEPPRGDELVQRVVAGVEAAERAIEEDRAPRDAVVGAWVALEEGAAESGVPRAPSTTPTEFALDVLRRTGADPLSTRRLLALYERARFSTEPVTDADVAAARECLADLRAGLSVALP